MVRKHSHQQQFVLIQRDTFVASSTTDYFWVTVQTPADKGSVLLWAFFKYNKDKNLMKDMTHPPGWL